MRKSSKARLFSTCLTGAVLAAAMPAWAQTSDAPTWKPRAEAEAQAGKDIGVSTSLFAPIAQNDSSLVYVDGRIGYDQRFDRNGSATVGARFRTSEDTAIGVNVGADFYRSDIGSRDQAALSMGLEGFSSVFDVRVNYRLPLSKTRTIGYIDPDAAATGALVLENNRLIERRSGFRLEAIPLQGFNGEAGVRLPVGDNASIRGSVGGFDYWDRKADENYRGVRGGLELDIEDKDSGARFTFGGVVEHDNRFGTDARAHVRLSIPFGGRAGDRGASPTGLDRQMGDRVRRDYVARSGSRYTDLTSNRFAVDARTGNQFGGFYYASGTGVTGAAGTLAAPTTLNDAVARAGANGVVVALGNSGNITTSGVTLATDQYLLGGASAVDVRMSNGSTAQFALGGTNGVIVGTNAAGAAVTLGQGSVVRDVTVRAAGVGIAANGVGGFAIDRVTIENTGGAGLSLTNTLGTASLTGLTVRGGAGAGVLINGGSSVSLANSTISGGAGAIDINDGGANLTTSLSNLTLSATGGNVLDIDGSGAGTVTVTGLSGITIQGGNGETGGLSVRSATFDASAATAGIQAVNGGRMQVGTAAARVNGQGVFLTDVTGSLSFTDLDIANTGATGLRVVNSKVNSFTLATLDGTIDTVGGTAVDLDPLVINLNFAAVSSVGAAGPGVILDTVEGGGTGGNALTIGTLTISNSGGDGLVILNSTGLVRVNGGAITNSGGSSVRIGEQGVAGSGGSAGLMFAGSITDPAGTAPIVAIFNAGGTINFTGPISGSGGILVQDTLAGSAISFGAITLTGTVGDAITLNGLAGSINFAGLVTIANPGANGIVIGTVPGGVTFGDVDITGLGNFNGLDVRNTHGTVLFNSLDITGTGTGTGINVTGSTNSGNVMILGPSVIQGVNVGVDLTQANMTGQFRFGDGNATPMNSTISANIPIVIALMNGSNGSYNFADANLIGDTTNLTGAGFTAYYARVGATGAGTRDDPGSLAGADASNAQYIVLLNDPTGGQDVFDAADAGGSFDLAAGQSLVSFLNGDFFAVGGISLPANLIVSGIGPSGITNVYAGSGGAVLTTSTAGAATVNLASNSTIDGLVIRNAGGDVGVEGSGVSNVRILNSDIAGATGAIAISDGGAASSVQLTNLDLASTAGTTLALSGAGAGTLTVSAADVDIAATGTSAALSLVDVASGGIGFGAVSTGTSATSAVTVQNVTGGALAFDSIAVGGTLAGEGVSIGGSSSAVTVQSISVAGSDGDAVQLDDNSGAISIGSINATVSGTNGNGLFVLGDGDIAIGTLTLNGGDVGLAIEDFVGSIAIGGGSISGAEYGVNVENIAAGGSVSIGALDIDPVFDGIGLYRINGSVIFTGTTRISDVGRAGIVLGENSTGTITFGDVDITGLGANTTGVYARDASGTVSFNTLDISGSSTTGTRGIDLTGATFAGSLTTADSGSITGVGTGVDLTNAAITGSFRYGDGSNTDADGAASSINAVIPIVITGINVGTGSYNFLDVALTGDTSALTSSRTLYFVKAGASGVGTMADPGSLAGAEASSADTIILLNDPTGGQDTLDAASAGGSFDLAAGRQLLSFLNGDTIMLPGGAPANLLLYGVPQGHIGNPYAGSGAPVLATTTVGANTVVLGGSNTIDGVIIGTAGVGGGIGVFGSGVANVAIRNSTISGNGGAIQLIDNGAAASAALSNLLLSSSGGVVLDLDGGGAGTLAITALDGITIAGGNGELGGVFVTDVLFDADLATAGAQAVVGALTIGSAGARVDGFGFDIVGDGSLDLTSLSVFNANGVGVSLAGNSDLTTIVRSGSIDTDGDAALVAQNAALALDFGSITAVDGSIFMLANTAADPAQPVLNVGSLSLTDGGLFLAGSGGDFVFANASITDDVGIGVLLGGGVNLDYAGDITSGPGSNVTVAAVAHTGSASFHDGTIDATGGAGLQFIDADGTYSFTGTTTLHGGDAGIHIASGSSGSFTFGAGTSVTDGAVANFLLENSDANVTYLGSLAQGLNTDNFVVDGQTGGVLDFSQATISASAGSGVLFVDADGTTVLGDVQLSGGAGVAVIIDSAGSISFGDVDIGIGANQTAVNLTGALGNVTFQTLDITGTSTVGSKGIDLSGSTTAANIIISESSTIAGVGIGVDLTNAAITGNFRYGDGSNTDADGAASTISAGVPIEITGLNTAVGNYDFADVNLIGDTSRLVTSATTYFVAAGATGVGTAADPGSLAGAEASGAQIIILLNDPTGGQDVLDAASAGGTFDLGTGQALLGFLNGDTLTLPAGGPTNLTLFGITPGQIVNPFTGSGAPVLTNTAATTTLVLGADTVVDGILIDAPNGIGIIGQYANTTIRNSSISAGSNAILVVDAAADTSVSLTNLLLSSSSGAVLNLDGTNAGTLTVTALDDVTILGGNGESAGLYGNSVVFDFDLATAGFQTVSGALTVGTTAARVGGVGLYLTQAEGDLNLALDLATEDTGADITGTGGFRFAASGGTIDVANGVAYGLFLRDLSADVVLSSLVYSGTGNAVGTQNVAGMGAAGRALDIGALSVANGAANAITMTGGATGSFGFGATSSIGTTTGAAILLSNSGASTLNYSGAVNYAGADAVLSVSGGHTGTINFSGTANVTSGTGLVFQDADGVYNFTGSASLATGVSITGGSAGSFAFGTGIAITNPTGVAIDIQNSTASLNYAGTISYDSGASAAVNIVNHSGGTVSFTGLLDVTFGSGLNFDNADGTYNFTGTTDLDAGNAGIVIANGSGGGFTFGADTTVITTGGSVLAVSASTASIDYLGYANAFGGNGISVVDHSVGTIDFTGATLTLNGATTVHFDNADGTYAFGALAMTSGATIEIVNGAAGSFGFGDVDIAGIGTGQTAVNLTGATGNVTFNTLDITGTSAVGSKGIDLSGNTGTGDIVVTNSSTITGVGIGVDLTNAVRTGLFQYGDGSSVVPNGAASTINATTPIVLGTGFTGGTGTYDFEDVNLVGNTTQLSVNAYFVSATGTGDGSPTNPGNLGTIPVGVDYIVLVDTQAGAGSFDTISGTITLAAGQSLLSFRQSETLNVGGGAPANVLLYNITGGVITNPNPGTGAPLLTSTNGTGTVQLGGTNVIDGVVVSNTGTGAGIYGSGNAGTVTIRNSTVSGGGAAIGLASGATTLNVNLQNLTLANAGNQTGALLNLDGTGGTLTVTGMSILTLDTSGGETDGLVFNTVTFDSDLVTAGIQAVNAGAITIGTSGARVQGDGLSLTNVSGALTFTDLDIANDGGTGLLVANSKANSFLLTTLDGSYDTTGGTAVNLDPLTVNITAASVSASGGAYGILLDQLLGSFTVTGTVNVSGATTAGIAIQDNTALTATFNGAVTINNTSGAGIALTNNTGATIAFAGGGGGVDVVTTSGAALTASGGGTISFAGSGNSLASTTGSALTLDGVTVAAGGVNFAGVAANGASNGVVLASVTATGGGTINLGTVNLQGITARGIDVNTALGAALSIADLDIGLNSTTATAFDLGGAALSAAITASDFDVTNAAAPGTSIAVDLRGTTGAQTVRLGDTAVAGGATSSIAGVGTGVYLDAATNAAFTFGDGESATDGTSTISATTGIDASAAPAAGSYNFTDVTFSASPGLGFGVGRTLFVDADGATGGGNGSGADGANPMTLAAAELILAATDVIVLVNNGTAISAAGSNGNDTLALLSDTQVRGFGQGPLALTLTVPSTIQLSSSTINIADPTGNGAATLTSAAGANVITLGASGNHISGFILDGDPAGALRGIVDNGGATGTVIDFMTIRNFDAVGGYGIEITPSTNTTIDNVAFTGNTNDVLLNAAGSTITNVTATGATGTSITLNNATGTTTLANVTINGAATGIAFATPGGTINATNVDIGGAATSALTITDGTASFNFDATSSITQAAGGLTLNVAGNHTTGTFAFAGDISATSGNGMQFSNADGTYNFTGTTVFNGGNAGIDIYSGATGTFAFGPGTTLTHNGAGNAFVLLSSANVTFDGAITDNDGVAVEIDAHDAGTATFNGAISSSIGNASTVISIVNSNGGAINFNGQMSIASTATVVSLSDNAGSTITFNAGGTGLDITSTTGTGMLITGGGTVNVQGSGNTIATTSGTLLSVTNTGATTTAVDLSFASATNSGGANGIVVQRTAGTLGGTVSIGTGAITASTRGISLAGDALDFTFGGTITATGGRSFEATGRTAGTVTLSGAIEDAFSGINIASNSGGTITLSGNLNAAGVGATGALTVTGNTGGTIDFSGGTKRFDTGAAAALNLTSNSGTTINFTNGGLAITTSSGAGLNATGGGTIAVTGAGNTIQTATGQIANLNAVSGGTGGINFASLASSGMVSGTAISFNNFDGTSFTVTGTTNITGGTGGGTDDGIFIGNNSAATVTFGATTIAGSIGDDGIEVNGAGNGAVTFSSVTIDNTLGHGVEINGSTGTVSINGGSIGATNDPASNGVLVTGGSGTVTIASSIAKTSAGSVVSVTGRTGGTVTFSGNITASGAVNNGISVASNTGGTVDFTGQTISLTTGANTGVNLATNTGATINFAPAGGGNGLDIVTTSGAGFSATGGGTVTVSGSGNTIQTATGQVINLTGVSAGSGGVNFATLTSTGVVSGIALNFSNFDSSGGGAFSGGTTSVAGASSDGIFIGAGSAANVSFGVTTIGTGANTVSGDGIEINGSGNGTVSFASVDIDNTTAHGVNVTGAAGATGAIAISGGTIGGGGAGSITGDGVNITGGSGNVSIAAAITKTNAGNVVEVSSHTGGAVILSGNLSATGGVANGILLNNNSGGTIAFSGASKTISTGANNAIQFDNTAGTGAAVSFTGGNLDIDTGAGRGITATSTTAGAGSLTITGSNNTIASAGGIALNLVNTNIAAGGLNFLSIAANGGARGIVLNNTGSTAGLTVTGTGTTDGSGGTIQNITARGIELLNTAQVNISNLNLTNASTTGQAAGQDLDLTTANGAIYMSSVATAVFENINITGTIADNGITGINVSNFQLNNSLITGAGDGANESGIEFSNLSGTSSLTNTEIAFSETNSLDIVNTDVNLNLTLNNVIFRDTQSSTTNGEGGLQFRSFSNAGGTPTTNIDIVDSDFLRLRTQGIQVIGEDDSVVSVDIVNNVIQSQADIGVGIDINGNDTATVNFNVYTNTIQSQAGHSVNITSFLDSNVMGRINGNTITANGSGAGGSGVRAVAQETSRIIIDVSDNSITAGAGNTSNMIDMQARFDTARLDATINNNNIDSDVGALADINITAGSSTAGESNQVYVNILNNDIAAGGPTNVLRLRVSDLASATRLFLTGFTEGGAGIEDDAVATWNNNTNTPLATTSNVAVSLTGTAVGPVAGTAQTPTNPTP